MIVWAFRRWVQGLRHNDGRHWTMIGKEFQRHLGAPDGVHAFAGFARMADALQRRGRRVMRVHQVCCPRLSADELCLVGLVAACQAPTPSAARARAEWLVRSEGIGELLEAGARLAMLMRNHDLTLPQRAAGGSTGSDTAVRSMTIH